ncbi:hypothetical protein CCANI_09720 [Corynebacterium canis]|nr:hypothetical protein CCANI_09720 [Corynebacterium canis]
MHNPSATLAVVYNLLPLGDLGAEISRQFSALRQIRHAGVLGTVFPLDAEFAVSDVPEADPARPMVRKSSILSALHGLANSLRG